MTAHAVHVHYVVTQNTVLFLRAKREAALMQIGKVTFAIGTRATASSNIEREIAYIGQPRATPWGRKVQMCGILAGLTALLSLICADAYAQEDFTYLKCEGDYLSDIKVLNGSGAVIFLRFSRTALFYFVDRASADRIEWGRDICNSEGKIATNCDIFSDHIAVFTAYEFENLEKSCDAEVRKAFPDYKKYGTEPPKCRFFNGGHIAIDINRINGNIRITTNEENEASPSSNHLTTYYGRCQKTTDPLAQKRF